MFYIDNYTIHLSIGDTASFTVSATGYTFQTDDRALLTIKDQSGKVVFEKAYSLTTNLGNGKFLVELHNEDTDSLAAGNYKWDVRYVIHPYYSDGRIVDGDQVITPMSPQQLILMTVAGEV